MIVIEGINLPKDGDCINISIFKDGSIYKEDENGGCYFHTGHKAIQIPGGAKLIDANKLKECESIYKNYYTGQEFRAITIEDLEEEPSVFEQA